jgi:hypothetical protein
MKLPRFFQYEASFRWIWCAQYYYPQVLYNLLQYASAKDSNPVPPLRNGWSIGKKSYSYILSHLNAP